MATTPRSTPEIEYPESDDAVSETFKHAQQYAQLFSTLLMFFAERPDVFVGGNNFVYYEEGDISKCFSPDSFVVLGVRPRPPEERGSYKIWEEGVPPTWVIELASKSTRKIDQGAKLHLYARLGIREYFLFDPLGTLLRPRLQGYRLQPGGKYVRLVGAELESEVLGLHLVVHEGWLRLRDPATGALVPIQTEGQEAYLRERAARLAAEEEITRLRAELARLRGEG
jgi:Uma2 family endonuclease